MKYSVITYIFNDYECLREVGERSSNCEYILITDNPKLKSDTWRVILNPPQLAKFSNPFDKCFYIRYHAFEFCETDIAITIDHSMKIKRNLDKIVDDFVKSNAIIGLAADISTGKDGVRNCINWFARNRGYSRRSADKQLQFLNAIHYNKKGAVEAGMIIRKKHDLVFSLDHHVWNMLFKTGINGHVDRLDQTILAVFSFNFDMHDVFVYDRHIWNSSYIQLCKHHSNSPFPAIPALKKKDKVYFNNHLVAPYFVE